MMGNKVLLLIGLSLVLINIQEANALKCWKCSSMTSDFCADPFDPNSLSAQQNRSAFMDCGAPFGKVGKTSHQVCKKEKKMINNKEVINRLCSYEDLNAPADSCEMMNSPYFCEICATDGCNGAQLISASIFIVISTLVIGILCN